MSVLNYTFLALQKRKQCIIGEYEAASSTLVLNYAFLALHQREISALLLVNIRQLQLTKSSLAIHGGAIFSAVCG